jgi:endonuclease G
VNIHGGQFKRLDRKDRNFEGRAFESSPILEAAADKWFFDPRIAESAQLRPPVFDETAFAFGHVTRREDPIWGDLRTARMANDDTFYMTNVATQHERFNSGIWLTLENAMLAAARDNGIKISVISGPVLRPDDPEVKGVQVPTSFWKVVAWVEGGALHSRGYLQSQRTLVDEIVRQFESLAALANVEAFEATVADIARMTSLDFGVLVDADEKAAGGPESRRGARLTEASVDALARSLARADRVDDDGDDEYRQDGTDAAGKGGGSETNQLLLEIIRNQQRLLDLLEGRNR